jgi:hypothetical protein
MDQARRFREAAAKENQGRQRLGWRYSSKVKALGVAHCRARRQGGGSFIAIAEELGISALTLSRWWKVPRPTPATFRPVKVVESETSAQIEGQCLCVVTPGGLRIEGLAWSQVLELAGVLG